MANPIRKDDMRLTTITFKVHGYINGRILNDKSTVREMEIVAARIKRALEGIVDSSISVNIITEVING